MASFLVEEKNLKKDELKIVSTIVLIGGLMGLVGVLVIVIQDSVRS